MAELAARSLWNLRFRLIAEAWVQIPAGSKSDLTVSITRIDGYIVTINNHGHVGLMQ